MKIFKTLLVAVLCLSFISTTSFAKLQRQVVGNLVWWDQSAAYQSIKNNLSVFSEVTPVWYRLDAYGNIIPEVNYYGNTMVDMSIVSYLKSNGILVSPSITNTVNYQWSADIISQIINNATKKSQHINAIVNLVVNNGYDGITLDYESLYATDRNAFSSFVADLSFALKNVGKRLSLDVHPKTSEPGTWNGPQAQDWKVLGQYADQIRIMVYDYSWSTSAAGPLAPIAWSDQVIAFAATQIPKSKIIHGMPIYGYDWASNNPVAEALTWNMVMSRVSSTGAVVNWDSVALVNWFQYSSSGAQHTVYFENERSATPKISISNKYDIGGIGLWRTGGEDPGIYRAIASAFPAVTDPTPTPPPPPPSDTILPTVTFLSPANNSTVGRYFTISVSASDNVGISLIELYVNGRLIRTSSTTSLSTRFYGRKLVYGANRITAVAYDKSQNKSTAEIIVYR